MAGLLKRGKVELTGEPRNLEVLPVPDLHTADDVLGLLEQVSEAIDLVLSGAMAHATGDCLAWILMDTRSLVTTAADVLRDGTACPLGRDADMHKIDRESRRQSLVRLARAVAADSGAFADNGDRACALLDLAGYGPTEDKPSPRKVA